MKKKGNGMLGMFRMHSVLVRILLVQFALALGVTAVLTLFFRRTYRTRYREELISSGLAMLNYTGSQLREEFNTLDTRMTDILAQPEVDSAMISGDVLQNPDSIEIVLLLRRLVEEADLADYAALWFAESNALLSSDLTVVELTEDSRVAFLLDPGRESGSRGGFQMTEDGLYLTKSIPRNEALATIAVRIDSEHLWNQMAAVAGASGEAGDFPILMYWENRPLFADRMEYPSGEELLVRDRRPAGKNDEVCTLTGRDRFLLASELPETGFRLLSIFSMEETLIPPSELLREIFPVAAAAILIVLISSLILLQVAYRPIGGLAKYMMGERERGQRNRGELKGVQNEFDLIRSLYQEQKDYEEELAETLKEVGGSVADKLLWDVALENEEEEEHIRQVLNRTQSAFLPEMAYQVILMETVENRENVEPAEQMLHRVLVQEYCRKAWGEEALVSIHENQGEQTAAILAFPQEVSAKTANTLVKKLVQDLTERFQNYPFHPIAGTGTLSAGILSLPMVYQEARKHLQENRYYDNGDSEAPKSGEPAYRKRFYQTMETLLQDLDSGADELRELVGAAGSYTENLRDGYVTAIDCLTDFMARRQIASENDWKELRQQLAALEDTESAEPFRERMEAFLDDCIERLGSAQTSEQRRYLENARKYMEEHYDDSMLSLSLVGEKCGISGGYLSRLFAKLAPENFTDTLNRYRVEQACRLLGETDATIADVGLRTGFNSPQNFSRVFKKYMGKTPGQYRSAARYDSGSPAEPQDEL